MLLFLIFSRAIADPPPTPAPAPVPITDEECRARGGHIEDQNTYASLRRSRPLDEPVTPFRICRIPSPEDGHACTDSDGCGGGRCFCAGPLARPNPMDDPALKKFDGTPGTGTCSDRALPDGAWFCLVEDGKVQLSGIIVD